MAIRVGIIGGGAAGMAAAVTAARQGAEVTLIEGNDRLGKKILITGNGKCNLGNENPVPEEYHTENGELLAKYLKRFGAEEVIKFFQSIGLMIKSKNGLLYPVCGQASAVTDVLRYAVREAGVRVVTECKIDRMEKPDGDAKIYVWGNDKRFTFDRVILACGGAAAPKTGSDGSGYRLAKQLGHGLIPVVPALIRLKCREDYMKSVAGVRADAALKVVRQGKCAARERGELQLTDTGISGIPVFQLSRTVNYILAGMKDPRGRKDSSFKTPYRTMEDGFDETASVEKGAKGRAKSDRPWEGVEIEIDLLPDYTEEDFERLSAERELLQGKRTVEEYFTGMLHKKLIILFIRLAGLRPGMNVAEADADKIRQVYRLCRHWRVHVTGSDSFDGAQVCAGGVPLDEVTEELESKKAPGVYFAGELLDVDGRCGGYNLHWAWCSGCLAGRAAAGAGDGG